MLHLNKKLFILLLLRYVDHSFKRHILFTLSPSFFSSPIRFNLQVILLLSRRAKVDVPMEWLFMTVVIFWSNPHVNWDFPCTVVEHQWYCHLVCTMKDQYNGRVLHLGRVERWSDCLNFYSISLNWFEVLI